MAATTTFAGRVSVRSVPSVIGLALALPSVMVRVEMPPGLMTLGEKNLTTVGGVRASTTRPAVAGRGGEPALVTRAAVAMVFV